MKFANKKIIIIILCILLLIPILKNKIDYYITYNKLSNETKEWINEYCKKSDMHKMFVSYYPEELYEYDIMFEDICK